MTHWILIFALAAGFFAAERLAPGRALPRAPGWYLRAACINACQLAAVLLAGRTFDAWLGAAALVHLPAALPAPAQGLAAWFAGTFVFYWWHRLRHASDACWLVFHQVHHSPARIETLTSFYKHPIEMVANTLIASVLLFAVLGCDPQAAGWFNVFAGGGEMFYHSNLRTPPWVGWFMQRPEHHSIHHALDSHDGNFGDITWWDRLFGTFRDTDGFAARCGFPHGNEHRLGAMLACRDAYAARDGAAGEPA